MKRIKDCTLIAIDTLNPGAAVASLRKSMEQCAFDEVILCTNVDLKLEGIKVYQIPEIKSKDDYSEYLLKQAYVLINTTYVLVTQHDSWILNGDCFDERLYQYDYAGALWLENDGLANGNGGFSWRSKRLMKIVAMDDHINATAPEDVAVCRVYRRYLEKNYDLKWASDDICEQFSFECRAPIARTFGFHGYFHEPYKPMVVIRRPAAMGDCIQCEPVMEYFYKKGYRVVLDTLPQFESLFYNHYFPVLFPHQVDPRVLATAKAYNLEMSYESNPKQLHLKSYYEFCEVPSFEQVIRNPKLNVAVDKSNTLFPDKYVCIHIDKRQGGRNVNGVDWRYVVDYLKSKGITVFQIGKGESEDTGAIRMNTLAEPLLMYMLAGAACVIGIDSGPINIAVALGRKCVVFHGSVNPEYIWPDMTNIKTLTRHGIKDDPVCDNPYCWHSVIGCEGIKCYIDEDQPPCTEFVALQVINAINELI